MSYRSCVICGIHLTSTNEDIDHTMIDFTMIDKKPVCETCLKDLKEFLGY